MDFGFTPEQEAFRGKVQSFFNRVMTPEVIEEQERQDHYPHGMSRDVSKAMAEEGLLCLTWPKKYGGQERSYFDRLVLEEEIAWFRVPVGYHQVGTNWGGPALILFGTEEQKAKYLPPVVTADVSWAQGYTEPNAGSDLSAIRTRAVADGDDWVINGSKIYTEHIQYSDYVFLLARTDDETTRHRGLSLFMLPSNVNGIDIRPLYCLSGYRVNEVYFEDVRIPRDALIGQLNRGFYDGLLTLDLARASGIAWSAGLGGWKEHKRDLIDVMDWARNTRRDGGRVVDEPLVKGKLAEAMVHIYVDKVLGYRVVQELDKGEIPQASSAQRSAHGKHFRIWWHNLATELLGPFGQLAMDSKYAPLRGKLLREYVHNVAGEHNGGSYNIMLNAVANRGLNLPR
jgi:acyl-CoA dehydrogenase